VNPPPERLTLFVDELNVPVRDVVLPPVKWIVPVALIACAWSVATNDQENNHSCFQRWRLERPSSSLESSPRYTQTEPGARCWANNHPATYTAICRQ